jgi:hypothetical protein
VFRRLVDDVGQLFEVEPAEDAEATPLTPPGEDWRSPAATDSGLMAKRGDEICQVGESPACRPVDGLYRIAAAGDQLIALAHDADDTGRLWRFTVSSDDPNGWDDPEDLGTIAGGTEIAISPDGAVVISTEDGLVRLEGGGETTPIAPDVSESCGIDFLDATRLAVATGGCDADPQIVLVDIDSGESRELEGDKGRNLAFEPE